MQPRTHSLSERKEKPLRLEQNEAYYGPNVGQAHPFLKKDAKTLLKEVIAAHRNELVTPGFPFCKGRHSVTFIPITGFQYFKTLFRLGLRRAPVSSCQP
jgi:hypothetical protein